MHLASEPAILYFGTPVVVISTVNEDGTFNLAPMSSAFWLGWRCMLGLGAASKTAHNLRRTRESDGSITHSIEAFLLGPDGHQIRQYNALDVSPDAVAADIDQAAGKG